VCSYVRNFCMLYWLMDLRYRSVASEWLYHHYLTLKDKEEALQRRISGATPSRTEKAYDDLHLRMAVFDPNVKQLKREEGMIDLKRTRGIC